MAECREEALDGDRIDCKLSEVPVIGIFMALLLVEDDGDLWLIEDADSELRRCNNVEWVALGRIGGELIECVKGGRVCACC
jgi:hypothetical protein